VQGSTLGNFWENLVIFHNIYGRLFQTHSSSSLAALEGPKPWSPSLQCGSSTSSGPWTASVCCRILDIANKNKILFHFFSSRHFALLVDSQPILASPGAVQGSMLCSQFSAIFANFRRKYWRFFSKTIQFLHNLALVWVKNANFLPIFFRKYFLKS
jgi:hypothetical protein